MVQPKINRAALISDRIRRRRRERGASVFIVVLVITMLTAIGVFAARSTRLSTTAGGHARQMTQTHYLSEYGMKLSIAAFRSAPNAYRNQLVKSPDGTCLAMANAVDAKCMKLYPSSLEKQLFPVGQNQAPLVEQPTATQAGSLGPTPLDAPFSVEVTNLVEGRAAPGYDLSPTSRPRFCMSTFTMTGTAQIRPAGAPTWTSSEASRAFFTFGPFVCLDQQ